MRWRRPRAGADAVPVDDDFDEPLGTTADGRRRRRLAAVVVGLAVLSALVGAYVGSRLKSPADAANERRAPRGSRITVPVEQRVLSSTLTLAGEIQFAEPTPISLGGSVGIDEGETAVVTRVPAIDQRVAEGDALFEVSGRPVFVLRGSLPTYRSLIPGSRGVDVRQLERALGRLGFAPGKVDRVFDADTERALDGFYRSKGYQSVGASAEDRERMRQLRASVSQAEEALNQATAAVNEAAAGVTGAELLALQQAVNRAAANVPRVEQAARRANDEAAQSVSSAVAARNAAIQQRDAAQARYDTARAPGAIDPATDEPYTADEIALRQSELAQAQQAVTDADAALASAHSAQAGTAEQGVADIQAARDDYALSVAQLSDATTPPDTSAAESARDDAAVALWQAALDFQVADAEIGTRLPAGEVVFVPTLPSTVTEVTATRGSAATELLATISSSATQIIARLARADSGLVTEGASVTIDLRDFDLQFEGTVTYVGQPRATEGGGGVDGEGGGEGQGGGGGSGRLEVIVTPQDPASIRDYVFSSARVIVDVASTDPDALVVPVAAVSVGGDGRSRVEVEVEPITNSSDGRTEMVAVEVGLTAQGLVEVRSPDGELHAGDRVVVGTETGERRDLGDETDGEPIETDPGVGKTSETDPGDEQPIDTVPGDEETIETATVEG